MFDPTAEAVFADGPVSAPNNPSKALIRKLFRQYETVMDAFTTNGGTIIQGAANLPSLLNFPALTMAWVLDPDPDLSGIYQKQGASGTGSWVRLLDLPYSVIYAQNAGAGTANAVVATSSLPISTSAYTQLISVPFTAANTGAMTLKVNDDERPLVTNTGEPIPAGYVQPKMSALVQIDGDGNYRLFSYGDASAIQAVIEGLLVSATAEADRAEAAAATAAGYDPTTRYPTPGLLFASTRGPAGDGSVWIGGNFAYREAAAGATDHDFENAAGVKFYFDEPEADPLAFPPVLGTDDTANFAHALEYAEKITLDPRHEYKIHNLLTVDRPVIIDWNGAKVVAAAGFADPQLMKITSSEVRFEKSGVLDGTNLPPMITGFIGTDFTGITLYALGTSGAPLDDLDLGDLKIISGECGAFYGRWCPNIRLAGMRADGINQHATYDVAAPISLDNCYRPQVNGLRVRNAKQKGISLSNSNNGQGGSFQVHSLHAGHAAIFMNGCNSWSLADLSTYGGFGIKLDSCTFVALTGINTDGADNGLGGVMIQGGTGNSVVGGTIKSFTQAGLQITYHGSKNLDVSETLAADLGIYGKGDVTAGSGLAAVGIYASTTYGAYGTILDNIKMRNVDVGVYCQDNNGAALIDRVELANCHGYAIKSFFSKGIARSFKSVGGGVAGSVSLQDVFRVWSQGQGSVLSIKDFEATGIGASANLLATGSDFGGVQYDQIVLDGCTMNGGRSLLYMNLGTVSHRVKSLQVTNSIAWGLAQAKGLDLNSASDTVVQVNIAGNSLYNSASVKQNIYFNNAAKFNGVVDDSNMAVTVNKPGNV